MFYHIKKKIIMANMAKKKKKEPFNLHESETFTLNSTHKENINNSYFFTAHDLNGNSFVIRLGLRNIDSSEVFVFLRTKDYFLIHPYDLYPKNECPVKVTLLEEGKRWQVTFDGELKEYASSALHHVSFNAVFTATRDIFDFFFHSLSKGMSEAMAREKWVKGYFDEVSKVNQRHYEQTGVLSFDVKVDERKEESYSLPCVRDHSFGPRDWNMMDDHIWICGLTEEGEVINFSFVNYPMMKKVYLGYTDIGYGKNIPNKEYQIKEYSFNQGLGSDHASFTLTMVDGKVFDIVADREYNVPIYFDHQKYCFQEGIGSFVINGKNAYGTIEYGFNQDPTRWNEGK